MKISVVVPCWNEEEALPLFYKAICPIMRSMREQYGVGFELIFVDDGSKDGTLDLLRRFAASDERVKYISFSRNFGKEAAILAGLTESTGNFTALMDADLQDPPALLPEMYEAVTQGGYDCAATRRVTRVGEPKLRSFFARTFYKLMHHISDAEITDGARDYRLMNRKMTDAVLSLGETGRFSKGIFGWVGFRTKWFAYENIERAAGTTKWSFWKLVRYSISGITAFSTAPLDLPFVLGAALAGISVLGAVLTLILGGNPYWYLAELIGFCSGLNLLCLGVLGQYLGRTFLEVKHRPVYIIKEKSKENFLL
ncbi:MAG TPA: glycosyltransferase family 2 protein [Oscillospiraceae bacterium]|mgnify:FL=1|nr:glycosyltransferase family 2 protein [Oscillospiraceae bacterium]HRW57480.1 glycosyltransferase family 2 protein [Oscillospiraceae bacterium]